MPRLVVPSGTAGTSNTQSSNELSVSAMSFVVWDSYAIFTRGVK
jgi:hypothetical protein